MAYHHFLFIFAPSNFNLNSFGKAIFYLSKKINLFFIVGTTLTEQHTLNTCKKIEQIIEYDTQQDSLNKIELSTENTEASNYTKPILRRSLRLKPTRNRRNYK